MKIEEQILSIKQVRELQELGFDVKKWINLFSPIKNFRKIFKRCPICGGKISYTEYPLKKSINEKNYKKIKIFYCKHCENKEEVVKKYFNKIQKG